MKPDERRRLPYAMNLRIGDAQYRGVEMLAHTRGVSMAEVVRHAIVRELSRFTDETGQTLYERLEADPNFALAADELSELVAD